jgi:hypothetical protein
VRIHSRQIKAEFWRSTQVRRLSTNAKLVCIGLWQIADREGRFEDDPERIACELAIDIDVSPCIDELEASKDRHGVPIAARYEVDGDSFGVFVQFTYHQNIHKREAASVLPEPPKPLLKARRAKPKDDLRSDPRPTQGTTGGQAQGTAKARHLPPTTASTTATGLVPFGDKTRPVVALDSPTDTPREHFTSCPDGLVKDAASEGEEAEQVPVMEWIPYTSPNGVTYDGQGSFQPVGAEQLAADASATARPARRKARAR